MKKLFFFASIVAVLASCGKEDEINGNSDGGDQVITLKAAVEQDTKIQPNSDDLSNSASTINFHWENGDKVKISNAGGSSIFTLSKIDQSDDSKAEFTGTPLADMSSYKVEYNYSYAANGSKEATQTIDYIANSFKPFIKGTGNSTSFTLDTFMPVLCLSIKGTDKITKIEYYTEDSDSLTVLNCSTGIQLNTTTAITFYLPLSGDIAIGTSGKEYLKFYDGSSELLRTKKLPDIGKKTGNVVVMPGLEFVSGLCFTAQEDGATVGMTMVDCTPSLVYSLDSTYYKTWDGSIITLEKAGDKVFFKAGDGGNTAFNFPGIYRPFYVPPYSAYFTTTNKVKLSGNIMYLLDGASPATGLTDSNAYCFRELFKGTTITDASKLVIPSGNLASNCFESLFEGCTNLTSAPALPSEQLASSCYSSMFKDCSNLTATPSLPAATVPNDSYHSMFQGCSKLTSAPDLPAITATANCYEMMFKDCKALISAPAISATTLNDFCYYGMFDGCENLTSAPALPAETIAKGCYYEMFDGCKALTSAPALPATTLFEDCYYQMFNGCSNLLTTPALNAPTLAIGCYKEMFLGCSKITSMTMLATDVSADSCLYSWLSGSGTLTVAPGMSSNYVITSNSGGWTIQEKAE